jgi:hypothetical protein
MVNKSFIGVALLAVVLMIILSYFFGSNEKEILRAELRLERLMASQDSLKMVIALKDTLQKILRQQISMKDEQANVLRGQVSFLEERREEEQLTVRGLRKRNDLQMKFAATFPEVADSDWGVREIRNEEADLEIEYLLVPLWFSETFIIDHQNSQNYKAQRDTLVSLDALNQEISVLKDSIFVIQEEKTVAIDKARKEAVDEYKDLNKDYINELKKPKFSMPHWTAIVGGIGVGYLIGKD